ncbi:methyltransferase family protein [Methanosarcina sp.]|uniref:methyltransferase family protein n=1 Tax=Methanosarcina sp. TaxID=2213 RepID=UPI003C767FFF
MIEFEGRKGTGRTEEWINWAISIVMLLLAAEAGKLLAESWSSLNHLPVYTYAGILFLYLLAEKAAYRSRGIKGRQSKKWTRSLLLFFWWPLLIVPVLEYRFYSNLESDFYPQHNFAITVAGASLVLIGTGLRAWGMWALGKYFSAHIEIMKNHPLIESGPYKFIRHPAYAGNILQAVGIPLVLNAYYSLGISAVLILLFLYRLKLEEEALVREIKGYEDYTKRTDRLIPKIW